MTRQNIALFVRVMGDAAGVLTVTFPTDLEPREAQRRLANLKRRVLTGEHFGESISVREFTRSGRSHFHLVIDCRRDITTGFNWAYHDEVTAWSKAGRVGPKPHGRLNCTPWLGRLHRLLRRKGPGYGIGRMELVPVRHAEAVGFYLGGYLSKSLEHKPLQAKGTRAVNYSQGCVRAVKGHFSWANESGWLYRAKVRTWARKHGCESMEQVKGVFGSQWAYVHRDAIRSTRLEYYPTFAHAAADGVLLAHEDAPLSDLLERVRVLGIGEWELREVPRAAAKHSAELIPPESGELRGADGEAPCCENKPAQVVAAEQRKAGRSYELKRYSAPRQPYQKRLLI
jgi:hypothetical protein